MNIVKRMEKTSYLMISQLFKLLSHQTRLRILDELRRGDACVCHLQTLLRKPQAYISQQLQVLREAGVVTAEKDGLNVFYHLNDPLAEEILEHALGPVTGATVLPGCPCPKCGNRRCCS